jgi:tRNA U54 and U55 pseudouridine synthase Pus10
VNTAKRKQERKEAKKKLEVQISLMREHPKECCICHDVFERTEQTVKTWKVTVLHEKKVVRLVCPGCWESVGEVLHGD